MIVRLAARADIAAIAALIARSVHGLMAGHLDADQRAAALGTVLGVDENLITDGTYFLVEDAGELVGVGGWSRRATLYGVPAGAARALDPAREPARIRAMFVAPERAGQGVGTRLLQAAEAAARAAGFGTVELMATPTGIAFYARHGYEGVGDAPIEIPGGTSMPGQVMRKRL